MAVGRAGIGKLNIRSLGIGKLNSGPLGINFIKAADAGSVSGALSSPSPPPVAFSSKIFSPLLLS